MKNPRTLMLRRRSVMSAKWNLIRLLTRPRIVPDWQLLNTCNMSTWLLLAVRANLSDRLLLVRCGLMTLVRRRLTVALGLSLIWCLVCIRVARGLISSLIRVLLNPRVLSRFLRMFRLAR